MAELDRRSFLKRTSAVTAGAVFGGTALQVLARGPLAAAAPTGVANGRIAGGYGALRPARDQDGNEILALPEGFTYVTFSKTGSAMSDGTSVPRNHDGMAAFRGAGGTTRLIRNHEVRNLPGVMAAAVAGPASTKYDAVGVGGTVTLDFDTRRMELVRDFVSLNGTIVNCAGGIAYHGGRPGWVTSEESVAGPANGWSQKHGYNFFVPASADAAVHAVPLTAMGRFAHEAVATDPATGIVYETEDSGNDSGFFRFIPDDVDDIGSSGRLEMLGIAGKPAYNALTGQQVGISLPVVWIPIDDPDPDIEGGATQVAAQGIAGGAAMFNRLEGIWYDAHTGTFFFTSTSGGDAGFGQVWQYDPVTETLRLFFESPGGSVLDSPDNLLVTPRGGILLCEDDASNVEDTHPLAPGITDVNRLIGLTPRGEAFELAVNRLSNAEFAGACFSPDGRVLFVNIFGDASPGSGMTCAITGPWSRGVL
jgi:hypothetical protein